MLIFLNKGKLCGLSKKEIGGMGKASRTSVLFSQLDTNSFMVKLLAAIQNKNENSQSLKQLIVSLINSSK